MLEKAAIIMGRLYCVSFPMFPWRSRPTRVDSAVWVANHGSGCTVLFTWSASAVCPLLIGGENRTSGSRLLSGFSLVGILLL